MARKKRELLSSDQIRDYIKSHMPFVMINNKIFDDFYENRELFYHPIKDNGVQLDYETKIKANFFDLDMVVFIFIHFIQINKVSLYPKEMASYLGCSEKALKESLTKLGLLRGKVKAKYNPYQDVTEILTEPKEVPLICLKMDRKGNRSKSPVPEYYIDFIPDHKKTKEGTTPINFFAVTIHDLDLLTSGHLTRSEFLLHLFFIRRHTEKHENQKGFHMSNSYIAECLKIKGANTTLNTYIDKLENMGFIQINKPKNYQEKLIFRQEPSREFIPKFNLKYMDQYRLAAESQFDELCGNGFE